MPSCSFCHKHLSVWWYEKDIYSKGERGKRLKQTKRICPECSEGVSISRMIRKFRDQVPANVYPPSNLYLSKERFARLAILSESPEMDRYYQMKSGMGDNEWERLKELNLHKIRDDAPKKPNWQIVFSNA